MIKSIEISQALSFYLITQTDDNELNCSNSKLLHFHDALNSKIETDNSFRILLYLFTLKQFFPNLSSFCAYLSFLERKIWSKKGNNL